MKKKVLLLGATGSIGENTLRVIRNNKDSLSLCGITCKKNKEKVESISKEFNTPYLVTGDEIEKSGLSSFVDSTSPDIILNGIASSDGLYATLLSLDKKIDLALSNKESIVLAGEIVMNKVIKNKTKLIPVDSEHSSIYNLLKDNRDNLSKLILTASGGPLLNKSNLKDIRGEDVIKHPNWKMGKKISVDSATLLNKGLEVIEASLLFNIPPSKIEVIINKESILHSAILLKCGMIKGEFSSPDMSLPISRALLGDGFKFPLKELDFSSLTLNFCKVDEKRFPLLPLSYKTLEGENGMRISYCISDEVAVDYFLRGKIPFLKIYDSVEKMTLNPLFNIKVNTYEEIKELSEEVKRKTIEYVEHY